MISITFWALIPKAGFFRPSFIIKNKENERVEHSKLICVYNVYMTAAKLIYPSSNSWN